ncbi:MAG: MoxR family ATPase [Caldisericia bacterium]
MSKTTNLQKKAIEVLKEVHKVYQGNGIVEFFVAGVVSQSSIFLQSSHGKGKSLLSESIAKIIGASYQRVQGTPALSESQFIGRYNIPSLLKDKEIVEWRNFLKAKVKFFDEINRVPPQTLSALHTVLAEKKAIYGNEEISLTPFIFIAAANPADAGCFDMYGPILDRFDMSIFLPTPTFGLKHKILAIQKYQPKQILGQGEIDNIWAEVEAMPITDAVKNLAFMSIRDLQICDHGDKENLIGFPSCCKECPFQEGVCAKVDNKSTVSERAYISALRVAKGLAYLRDKSEPEPQELFDVLPLTLAHRINILPAAYPGIFTKQEAIENLVDDLQKRITERKDGVLLKIAQYNRTIDRGARQAIRKTIEDACENKDLLGAEMFADTLEEHKNRRG